MFRVKIVVVVLTSFGLLKWMVEGEEAKGPFDIIRNYPSSYYNRAFNVYKEMPYSNYGEYQNPVDVNEKLMEVEREKKEKEKEKEKKDSLEEKKEKESLKKIKKNRLVITSLTADQIASSIAKATLDGIKEEKWDISKKFQQQYANIPYMTDGSSKEMRLELRKGDIKGLASFQSESATLNNNTNEIAIRFSVRDLYTDADYGFSVPAAGVAPANNVKGHVQNKLTHAWMDAAVRLDDNGLPLNIQSFTSDSVNPHVTLVTNLNGNKYAPIYKSVLGEALKQITLKMLRTNIRVKVNQGVQKIKEVGSYSDWL